MVIKGWDQGLLDMCIGEKRYWLGTFTRLRSSCVSDQTIRLSDVSDKVVGLWSFLKGCRSSQEPNGRGVPQRHHPADHRCDESSLIGRYHDPADFLFGHSGLRQSFGGCKGMIKT
ncbi:hypothetical protein MAPG_05704 [Magnaporthiopsis poae ATCC 64411]|uniref:Uncharacterized protein n=1 Tax=Magnaporthiopsis poae (strain ATCC 64411 / 73-15) TaxID=644358 RepID=A0A0C4E038_MAGP6|nr:hypothetical protein MAPG_05704 [Magnaporthiopsis poae ATCC 64411]